MAVKDPYRLHVASPAPEGWLRYDTPGLLLGSCFAGEVGNRLEQDGFEVTVNPYGTAYNPITTLQSLSISWDTVEQGIVKRDGIYVSHVLHSDVWGHSVEELRQAFETSRSRMQRAIHASSWMSLTLGTAWVYTRKSDGLLCANLHKQPASLFERELLTVERILSDWQPGYAYLREQGISHFVVTVSPVIHGRDGLSENSLSKSVLRLAAEQMAAAPGVTYFPSLEIIRDELRDYRFYSEDMQHPSRQAANIVYERFLDFALSEKEQAVLKSFRNLAAFAQHKPRTVDIEMYARKLEEASALRISDMAKERLTERLKAAQAASL